MFRKSKALVKRDFEQIKVRGHKLNISKRTAKLLYFSNKNPQDILIGKGIRIVINIISGEVEVEDIPSDDPSTIFVKLPVKEPRKTSDIPRPDYYPTYARLTPEQRWIYLHWLQDISQPIDIGYVFLYYYGLERHLLLGEFDLALNEILFLRKHHTNNSFTAYSNSALLQTCINKDRPDRLREVYERLGHGDLSNAHLLIAYKLGFDLSAEILIEVSKKIREINKRYIKNNPELFKQILDDSLREKYRSHYFPFASKYKIERLPGRTDVLFANISFPEHIRTPNLPNFFEYAPFTEEIKSLFAETHDKVKAILKERRKRKS